MGPVVAAALSVTVMLRAPMPRITAAPMAAPAAFKRRPIVLTRHGRRSWSEVLTITSCVELSSPSTRYADLKFQVKRLRLDFVTEISDGTPWLSDTELAAWMPFSAMLMGLPSALDTQLQRDAKLSLFGYFVLAALSEAPERTLPMSDVAVLVVGSLSRLSHAVSPLERRGWVPRHTAPGGRRRMLATLTEAGYAKGV